MQNVQEGQIVWVQGYEFRATDVRYHESRYGGPDTLTVRFTGVCTDNPVNAAIRDSSYNGGTYGWFLGKK